ncbi:MAG: FtsW [Acidimicrobiales bacterium]|nr:FtsW [Acidimicrobiales bacterium]
MTATAPFSRRHERRAASVGTRVRRLRLPPPPGEATGAFWLLAAVVTVLNMIGLVMVLSASSVTALRQTGTPWSYFEKQAMWTVFGLVALAVFMYVDVGFWRRHAKLWLAGAFGLLVLVLVPGIGASANGATRWIAVGPLQIQPSEFAKFALLIFVADLLADRADLIRDWRWTLAPVLVYLGGAAALIMMQPNLGTTVILATMVLAMLYAAGTPLTPLTGVTLVGVAAAAFSVASTPFRRARFLRFLDPWKDPSNTGYQTIQSMVGLADGGLLGKGLGSSRAKWGFLPYAHTDFIFAIIGEEFGMIGGVIVVFLFLTLGGIGAWAATRARDRFGMLVAVGVTAWMMVQAIINIGAVIGILPITGVPLPFLSFGGSSLLVNLAATGLLLNVSRHPVADSRPSRRRRSAVSVG